MIPSEAIQYLRERKGLPRKVAEAVRILCDTHPDREERVGERVGDVWTHPKGAKDPILFGPMAVMKRFLDSPEVTLLMTDGERWDFEELRNAGWVPPKATR